uniref:Uncharacterized protein n=1 Tax=Oryza rufipogon TaxID=4529 RepID=A0A0E0NH79_ORYRU
MVYPSSRGGVSGLGWTCGRGFGQVDMIHNGGTRESSDRLALLRPSKCPTARTDQYPTGQ